MKRILTYVLVAGVAATIAATAAFASAGSTPTTPLERGRYLVATSGCNGCHTPLRLGEHGPEPDVSRKLSGHPSGAPLAAVPALTPEWPMSGSATNTAWAGPWGVSFSANLTPDAATGLGAWTAEEFVAAIRTGRHQGRGRPILPPMPAPSYAKMTDDDLHAIFLYLRSLPAIVNKVPEPLPPR